MKKLMDRLMARQLHLLQNLEPPRQVPRLAPELLAERRASEQRAVEAAFECLATGDIVAATSLLEPHADGAQDTRTLTTLSRIRSASGHMEEALGLLQRAESLDPTDNKVAFFLANHLQLMGRHQAAIAYRRRIAFTTRDAPAHAFLSLIGTIVKASSGKSTLVSELRVALAGLRRASDVTLPQLAEAARLVYTIEEMSADAVALLAEADPCPADQLQSTAKWATLEAWSAAEGRVPDRIGEEGAPGRRPRAVELANVTVHPALHWVPIVGSPPLAILSGLAPDRIPLRNENPASPMVTANAATALLRLPTSHRRNEPLALLLGGTGSYYHDTIEAVSVLAITERLGVDRQLPLVVSENPAPHMTELLGLLGYEKTPLLQVGRDTPVHFERLLVTTRLSAGSRWFDPMLARWYRQRLVEPLGKRSTPRRKLYLSRAGAAHRKLANEAELVGAIQPLGYEVIHPETMSVSEQIALFAQASHIVGPSGAALTNVIYALPGARVVVLQNKQLAQGGGLSFEALAQSCGHRATTLECAPSRVAPGERPVDADLIADVESLLRCLTDESR